ncbi:MAG: bifunctional folylpolyglutamate synthase/dihydrofolate synthase [Aestuariivita sp.]|nr:bifunctional folylpolyglutamate synthase/dihydrofolate synthase [Aestuariivita sp.]
MTAATSDVFLTRMMALHPKVIDLTLERVWRLLERTGNPQNKLPPVIHIAGTNGKGSTLAMIRAGLEANGRVCHAFTSPHLVRFHERIRIAGQLIDETELSSLLEECYSVNDSEPITYFEITTCAALLAFARRKADYCLLEVGMGGRLDATNVIDKPAITVITPISIDHEAFLGNTVSQIAYEKAGIIKQGVPCIVSSQPQEAYAVISKQAQKAEAPVLAYGHHWTVTEKPNGLVFEDDHGRLDLPQPSLLGSHQIQNAGAAIAALTALGFNENECSSAMTKVQWPARMQRLKSGPLVKLSGDAEVWLDGGHNPAASKALAQLLKKLPWRPAHLICGMLNSRDIKDFLEPFTLIIDSLTGVTIPGMINSYLCEDIARSGSELGIKSRTAETVQKALENILRKEPQSRVLICGSLHLSGAVLSENG